MNNLRSLAVLAALAIPTSGHAGGLFVPGAGPQAQARAGAFVAKSDDPTALLHNPAGFAKLNGTHILLGANFIDFDLTYQRAGGYELSGEAMAPDYEGQPFPQVKDESSPSLGIGGFQAIPAIAMSTDFGMPQLPLRFGFGIYVPQGFPEREFAESYDVGTTDAAPGPQRYDIISQSARIIAPSVAVAYSPLPVLDVGVRLSWGFGSIKGRKAVWSIRNYEEYAGRDSIFTLFEGKDNFIPSYSLGVLYRPAPFVEFGASYSSQQNLEAKGTGDSEVGGGVFDDLITIPVEDEFALCAPGGEIGALKACVDAKTPMTATVGARWITRDASGREKGDVELDVRWENFKATSNLKTTVDGRDSQTLAPFNPGVTRHGFGDVLSFRLGGAYAFELGVGRLIARAGAAYDTAAAPESWSRVDFDGAARTTLTTGLAFETSRFRVEVGGGVSLEADREVVHCRPPDGPSVSNAGCDGSGTDTPVLDRNSPDPLQPKQGKLNQVESPFNAGTYQSGYLLFSVGVTTWF